MKNKKLNLILTIISFVFFSISLYLFIYFFTYPYRASLTCKIEEGCMNESGMLIIVALMILPFLLLFLSTSIFLSIIYYKKHSKYSNKKYINRFVHVIIDRKIGTHHPKHDDIIYPINYGFVPGLIGGDGEEQDVYVLGVDEPIETFDGKIIAVIYRYNDNETKWVAAPYNKTYSEEEIIKLTHFQEQFYKIKVIK